MSLLSLSRVESNLIGHWHDQNTNLLSCKTDPLCVLSSGHVKNLRIVEKEEEEANLNQAHRVGEKDAF